MCGDQKTFLVFMGILVFFFFSIVGVGIVAEQFDKKRAHDLEMAKIRANCTVKDKPND